MNTLTRCRLPILLPIALGALGLLSGCNASSIQNTALNVTAAAPTTCADLQLITGNLAQFAGQVAAANTANAKVQAIIAKLNAGTTLANADCTKIAALAPSIATGVSSAAALGVIVKP